MVVLGVGAGAFDNFFDLGRRPARGMFQDNDGIGYRTATD
jgi:hypothetical protein